MKEQWEEWKASKEKLGVMFWLSAFILVAGTLQWFIEPALWIYVTSFKECIKLSTGW